MRDETYASAAVFLVFGYVSEACSLVDRLQFFRRKIRFSFYAFITTFSSSKALVISQVRIAPTTTVARVETRKAVNGR